jgi:predicted O-methyltransferase YrrM
MQFNSTWIVVPKDTVEIKNKTRQLLYNQDLNLYRRKRTFDGIIHLKHWNILNKYIDFEKPLNCLEIGTHEGQSAMYFLKYILKNPNSRLLCCDPFIKSHWLNLNPTNLCYEDVLDYNVKINNGENKIIKYRGLNTALFKETWFQDKTFDIIYIDDDHTYEHTLENIKNCFPKLKSGGVMIFDDYDAKYYIENKENDDGAKFCYPVHRAVNEFIDKEQDHIKIIHKLYQIIIMKL